MKIFKKLLQIPNQLGQIQVTAKLIIEVLTLTAQRLDLVEKAVDGLARLRPPWVSVLIFAEQADTGEAVTMAMSHAVERTHTFSFQPNVSIRKLQFVILVDLQRVVIKQIVCANIPLAASHECAPVAWFGRTVHPSNRITIEVANTEF